MPRKPRRFQSGGQVDDDDDGAPAVTGPEVYSASLPTGAFAKSMPANVVTSQSPQRILQKSIRGYQQGGPIPRAIGPGIVAGPALPVNRIKPSTPPPTAAATPTDFLRVLSPKGFADGGVIQKQVRIRPRSNMRDYGK
jgi:hypothetical protein